MIASVLHPAARELAADFNVRDSAGRLRVRAANVRAWTLGELVRLIDPDGELVGRGRVIETREPFVFVEVDWSSVRDLNRSVTWVERPTEVVQSMELTPTAQTARATFLAA